MKLKVFILLLFVCCLLLFPSNAEPQIFDGWESEIIDEEIDGDPIIEMDSNDNPHIIYIEEIGPFDGGYRYIRKEGNQWKVENLPFGVEEEPSYLSFKLDSEDNPHITYFINGILNYAEKNNDDWVITEIDQIGSSSNDAGKNVLCIDNNDDPHILYLQKMGNYFEYTWMENGEWNSTILHIVGTGRKYFSMAIDDFNDLHICYFEEEDHIIKYLNYNNGKIEIENVEDTKEVGTHCSIVVDGNGSPYITYKGWTGSNLKYANKKNGIWNIEIIEDYFPSHSEMGSSIRIGNNGRIYVGYRANHQMIYAIRDTDQWKKYSFDHTYSGSNHEPLDLAIDSAYNPHFVYYRTEDETLRYASLVGELKEVKQNDNSFINHTHNNIGWILLPLLFVIVSSMSIITYKSKKQKKPESNNNFNNVNHQHIGYQTKSPKNRWHFLSSVLIGVILLIMIFLPFLPFWSNGYYYEERFALLDDVNTVEKEYNEDFSVLYRSGSLKSSYNDNTNDGANSQVGYYYLPGAGEFSPEMGSEGWKNNLINPNGPILLALFYVGPFLMLLVFFNLLLNCNRIPIGKKKIRNVGIISSVLLIIYPIIYFFSFQFYKMTMNLNGYQDRYYDSIHMGFAFYFCIYLSIPVFIVAINYKKFFNRFQIINSEKDI